MTPTIVFVTGANTGLGYETVKALIQSSRPHTVILGSRSLEKGEAAAETLRKEFPDTSSTIETVSIDIESDASIDSALETISSKHDHIDVLLNNAGAQFDNKWVAGQLGDISMREMFNRSWDVNVTGTHILTYKFVPLLLKSSDARIVFITSGTSTLAGSTDMSLPVNRLPAKGWPKKEMTFAAYRSSKTGLNMLMRDWVRVLSGDGVKVFAVSPGLLATNLGGNPDMVRKLGGLEPSVGANVVRSVVEGERDADVGKVIFRDSIQAW